MLELRPRTFITLPIDKVVSLLVVYVIFSISFMYPSIFFFRTSFLVIDTHTTIPTGVGSDGSFMATMTSSVRDNLIFLAKL